jgi:hypothetical protein
MQNLMPGITAILHTKNDALRIARAIESLRPCDEVLVVDHGCRSWFVGRNLQGGAPIPSASDRSAKRKRRNRGLRSTGAERLDLFLHPTESLSESLEASVLEWKLEEHTEQSAFGVTTMEETLERWILRSPETRLAHRKRAHWQGWKPQDNGIPNLRQGHLTRLRLP